MADRTKISWASTTWNPITGCTPVSEGCQHCYARRMAKRLQAMGAKGYEDGFKVTPHPERLDEPLHWRKPRRIFVCSMGDLFHEDVLGEFVAQVFDIMQYAQHHTYLVLTKRPGNLAMYFQWHLPLWRRWHIWYGTTAENQKRAYERIPVLTDIPCAHLWVSLEPLLGPVDLRPWLHKLGWVVVGGESGPRYRPMHIDWVRDVRDKCVDAGVPFYFKQFAGVHPKKLPELDGRVWDQQPKFGASEE